MPTPEDGRPARIHQHPLQRACDDELNECDESEVSDWPGCCPWRSLPPVRARQKKFVQADANKIRQRTQEFEAAFNAKDAAKVAAFYPGEASSCRRTRRPSAAGRKSRSSTSISTRQGGTDLEMDTKDVRGHGTLAYEAGTYSLNRRPRTGPRRARPRQVPVHLANTDGVWTIESNIWSSDLPEMVPLGN